MKLPSILALLAAVVVVHWLHRRLERVEQATGVWRVQPPWSAPTWYGSWEFDEALRSWERELRDDAA